MAVIETDVPDVGEGPTLSDTKGDTPLISFGIITDVQYADIPNGANFKKTKTRYYRNSVHVLADAVDHWNCSEERIEFVLQLGDVIDGFNNRTPGASDAALAETLKIISRLKCPTYHAIGNHELYNFKRSKLMKSALNSTASESVVSPGDAKGLYYHFSPSPGLRMVMLDTYDVSLLGHEVDSREYRDILNTFRKINKNEETHDPSGLAREQCMYAAYNGGVSREQLVWLEQVLSEAEAQGERVIVAGHDPIQPGSTSDFCLCWNHAEVRAVLQSHHSSIIAYIAGHFHNGGYACDHLGIHYVTIQGVVDTPPGNSCYATAHVYEDRVEIKGHGIVPDYTLN